MNICSFGSHTAGGVPGQMGGGRADGRENYPWPLRTQEKLLPRISDLEGKTHKYPKKVRRCQRTV